MRRRGIRRGKRRRHCALAIALSAGCGTRVLAVTGTWKSAVSDTWTDSAAWTGGLPTHAGDTATISATGSAYTVSLGQSLNLASGSVTLNSSAATLNIAGGSVLSAYYFTVGSGTISGTVQPDSLTLNDTGTGSGGVFLFNNGSGSVSGAGGTGDTLQIGPSPAASSVSVSFYPSSINANVHLISTRGSANTINLSLYNTLTSNGNFIVDGDASDSLASDNVRSISGSLTNSVTGRMQFNTSASVSGTLTNQGTMNIAGGAIVSANTFVQQSGQLTVNGSLNAPTFTFNGGTVAGSGPVNCQNLSFSGLNSASGTFAFNQSYSYVTGSSVPQGVTLMTQPTQYTGYMTLYVASPNYGTIDLNSSAGVSTNISIAPYSSASLVNNGTINVAPDPSLIGAGKNVRTNSGTIVNYGSVNIASGSELSGGTFNQAGGTLTINGIVGGSAGGTFSFGGGPLQGRASSNAPR